ncbi:MAG: hypothetical protein COA94_06270 [Rickettsiales bacterium]|nr:MAG: hypothetical protein COA94_06270 [Rickettsiales bacterium]
MRSRILIVTCLSLLIFAGGVALYLYPSKSTEIITLTADTSPTKKKPTDPGGMVLPNSDSLVYEKLKTKVTNRKIRILPEPEAPIEIRRTLKTEAKFLDSIEEILDNIEYYEAKLANNKPDALGGSQDSRYGDSSYEDSSYRDSSYGDSRYLDSNYVMPNILIAKSEIPDDMMQDNPPQNDSSRGPHSILIAGTKLNITRAAEPEHKMAQFNLISKDSDGYKIQLSSAYSLASAETQWKALQKRHAKILKGAALITKRVEGKNERIFYLVMAGTYSSLSHAKSLCRKLGARKQNCIITR